MNYETNIILYQQTGRERQSHRSVRMALRLRGKKPRFVFGRLAALHRKNNKTTPYLCHDSNGHYSGRCMFHKNRTGQK